MLPYPPLTLVLGDVLKVMTSVGITSRNSGLFQVNRKMSLHSDNPPLKASEFLKNLRRKLQKSARKEKTEGNVVQVLVQVKKGDGNKR